MDDTYGYDSSGYLFSGSINYSGYSDPSDDGTGTLTYDEGYLDEYSVDGSDYSDSSYFDDEEDPYDSDGYDDASDYGDYGDDDYGDVAQAVAGVMAMPMLAGGSSGVPTSAALLRAAAAPAPANTGTTYFRRVGFEQGGSISSTRPGKRQRLRRERNRELRGGIWRHIQRFPGATFIANIGSFSDTAGGTSDYTANINWGDGSVLRHRFPDNRRQVRRDRNPCVHQGRHLYDHRPGHGRHRRRDQQHLPGDGHPQPRAELDLELIEPLPGWWFDTTHAHGERRIRQARNRQRAERDIRRDRRNARRFVRFRG